MSITEMKELNAIEHLHAERIDRIERYINSRFGGECAMRTLIVLIIKDLSEYPPASECKLEG